MISISVCITILVIYRCSQGLLDIVRITENILKQKWFNGHLSGNNYENSNVGVLFIEMILFLIRKDKYKAGYDCAQLYALKHMAKLRKQVKNARSEKAYFLFYNRLVGAFETYVHLGIFTYKQFDKLCDVRGKFVFNQVQKKMYEEN